jgi:hypothetical protein
MMCLAGFSLDRLGMKVLLFTSRARPGWQKDGDTIFIIDATCATTAP